MVPVHAPSQAHLGAHTRTWRTNPPWARGCRELPAPSDTENLPRCLFFLAHCPLAPKPPPPPASWALLRSQTMAPSTTMSWTWQR